jgi:hypothetical protein
MPHHQMQEQLHFRQQQLQTRRSETITAAKIATSEKYLDAGQVATATATPITKAAIMVYATVQLLQKFQPAAPAACIGGRAVATNLVPIADIATKASIETNAQKYNNPQILHLQK